ncbi:putative PLP-dependent enzyme possibly involved in cell wall biogenesis [Desulfosporosinus orientis DSM 765]|uniref:Putative PLP-dependent enzyme possibly involved in cell wall biogenesis n=1 Tax=Desulfosporosinus orientis (strain ATCC 19365 / DSM 765 / NCIMB 8382 / VKM B-1628 / Singapore I) TaxID=768706 RepID=G7W545_DESOD|nr:putative PLP-dependent enzyme possibly involved in cell wall biogenesis [Desulfosporosinus orientis DSM 765]
MKHFIPLSVPNLRGNELNYLTDAINKEWVSTGGTYIARFETELAHYLKVYSAVACQSGTAGLHLALILAGVEKDHEVIVPTLTFIASANPVKYCHASPIFMDCDNSLCMDMAKLKMFCQRECNFLDNKLINKTTGKQIKAVVVVHVFGNMADMPAVMDIAKKYNLIVIEDATEALGTYYLEGPYQGKYAGTIGDIGVYSFNGNKIITTGGGGMIVSSSREILKRAKYLSTQAKDDAVNFFHNEVGYNYRLTNLQAALGVAQLEQLEHFISVKKENYERYKRNINGKINGIEILDFREDIRPNYWFYSLYIMNLDKYTRRKIIDKLAEGNIQTRPVWGLIHEQKPYLLDQAYKIEKAPEYHRRIVNLPCSSNLSASSVYKVINTIKSIS